MPSCCEIKGEVGDTSWSELGDEALIKDLQFRANLIITHAPELRKVKTDHTRPSAGVSTPYREEVWAMFTTYHITSDKRFGSGDPVENTR